MKYFFSLLALLTCTAAFGQGWPGSWEWQNPRPSYQRLSRFFFLDSLTGYGATHSHDFSVGRLMKTTDGGLTWTSLTESARIKVIHDLDFADTLNGWAVGPFHALLKTADGGRTWEYGTFAQPDTVYFDAVEFRNRNHGLAIAHHLNRTGRIYRTVDGGATWDRAAVIGTPADFIVPYDVDFANDSVAFVVGNNGLIAKSVNGGASWTYPSTPSWTKRDYYATDFINPTEGWLRSKTAILHTTNGGASWDSLSADPFPGSTKTTMRFLDASRGWITSARTVALTTDGGRTWTLKTHPGGIEYVSTAQPAVLTFTSWLMGSTRGKMYKTTDQGQTYQLPTMVTTEDMFDVHFSDDLQGFTVGGNHTILRTYNGGETWRVVHTGNQPNTGIATGFTGVYSFGDTAFAVAKDALYTTTDGGGTWQVNANVQNGKLITFVSPRHGWIAQEPAGLLETTNGGATWTRINTTLQARNLVFTTHSRGFISGSGSFAGRGAFTVDGGRTWTPYNFPSHKVFTMNFADTLHGWAAGAILPNGGGGAISRTTDGGRTWAGLAVIANNEVAELSFADANHGWARFKSPYTGENKLYSTRSGGRTWLPYAGDQYFPSSFHFNPSGRGWYTHDSGGIVRFETGNQPWARNLLQGSVYKRNDDNCERNWHEEGLNGRIVRVEPGPRFATTNPLGIYSMRLDSGTYRITSIANPYHDLIHRQVCPDSGTGHTVRFPMQTGGYVERQDFAYGRKLCPLLDISSSSGRRRPCFGSSTLVRYNNTGYDTARNVQVYVQVAEGVVVLGANNPYQFDAAANAYRFDMGSLAPRAGGVIEIRDSVVCDTSLMGDALCTRVWITPANRLVRDGGCLENPSGFDGSNISVRSFCGTDTTVGFSIRNRGDAMDGPRRYRIFRGGNMSFQSIYQLGAGDSLVLMVPRSYAELQNRVMLRLEADQHPRHPFDLLASAFDRCPTTSPMPVRNIFFAEEDESPDTDTDCNRVVGSFDPNDKQVFPAGVGPEGKILPETMLEYKIRFQNTGTDTAYQVVIADTLADELDLATLEYGSASHKFTATVVGNGKPILMISFPGIRLVDSVHNEKASHGHVTFRIRPRSGLALGTRIANEALIYFDYNAPVRTNQAVNTLYEPVLITAQAREVRVVPHLRAQPNPARDQLTVTSPRTGTVEVLSLQGKRLMAVPVRAGVSARVPLGSLPRGMYLLRQQELNLRIVKE